MLASHYFYARMGRKGTLEKWRRKAEKSYQLARITNFFRCRISGKLSITSDKNQGFPDSIFKKDFEEITEIVDHLKTLGNSER